MFTGTRLLAVAISAQSVHRGVHGAFWRLRPHQRPLVVMGSMTATAGTVTGELDTSNNSASTTTGVAAAADTHDVAVLSVNAPATATKPPNNQTTTYVPVSVTVENQGTVEETFDVTLSSNQSAGGTLPDVKTVTLDPGASTVLNFDWGIKKNNQDTALGTHILTATADTVAGETDTGDNAASTSIVIN